MNYGDMKFNKDYLIIATDNGWKYDIPKTQLKTTSELKEWVEHMSEKTWFKQSMRKEMIEICEKYFGYKFN